MAQQVFGPAAVVSVLNRAFTNTSPSNAVFNNQLTQAGTTEASQIAFAESFGATFAVGKTAADLSALVMANMGLDNALLASELTSYITDNGLNKIGIIAYQLGSILSILENDGTYGAAAKAWNAEVTASYEYSADPSNTVPSTSDVNGNEAGKNFVLTTNQDVRTGTSGDDFFRGVAGNPFGAQDQTTLNSSDILDGAGGNDVLILNLLGNYGGGARIKNIQTLKLGSNVLGNVTFDYNVNAGQNEITNVETIVYDQINVGERLAVNNLLKTVDVLPTVAWVNEAGSQAGAIDVNYRASAVAGPEVTNQNVTLENVAAVNADATTGRLNIGGGVETITINSSGTTANTLNNSVNVDGRGADLVSGSNADGNDNGALTTVVVKGEKAFGRAATVVTNDTAGEASFGLTNRASVNTNLAPANDLGRNDTQASASNLISVAGTVTEIDAIDANGGVAMRFVGRTDNGATNVTFKGGKAADYIEFERGNVNAAGGEGNDTFAFINNGLTSFDFGSADTIVGGAGMDTIQLGLNGEANSRVVASTTEFNNKTGIETLDLRAQFNTVTLSDAFVAGADEGVLTVRTDKIVQVSDASTANTAPSLANNNSARENGSDNTIVLTQLSDNRAIKFVGGSGSDRVVVNNASANQYAELDGGSNTTIDGRLVGNAVNGTTIVDSLTVVDTSVLDSNDVRNIKNFEFVNFVETTTSSSNFTFALSETFVLANANGLVLGSTTGTYGNRLGAGDVVNLEVSDLYRPDGTVKTSVVGRTINVQDLIAAGVTVNFQQNGTTVSTNAAPAGLNAFVVTNVAPVATVLGAVAGAAGGGAGAGAAVVTPAVAGVLTNGTATADNFTTTQANLLAAGTAVDGLAGADTLTLTGATTTLTNTLLAAKVFNVETLKLADAANTLVLGAAPSVFENIIGGALADTVTLVAGSLTTAAAAAAVNTIDLGAGNDSLTVSGALALKAGSMINGGAGIDTLNIGAATNLAGVTVTGFEVINVGANTLTINRADLGQYTNSADRVITANTGTIAFADAGVSSAVADFAKYTLANVAGVNSFTNTLATGVDVTAGAAATNYIAGGAGNDTITGAGGKDIIKFGATAAANGNDSIKAFQVAGADLLDFTAFLGGAASVNTTAFDITGSTGSVLGANNVAVAYKHATGTLTATDFQTTTGSNKIAIEDNSKAVILVSAATGTGTGTGTWNLYYVEDTNTGTGATDQTWVVTLVGTLDSATSQLGAAVLQGAANFV